MRIYKRIICISFETCQKHVFNQKLHFFTQISEHSVYALASFSIIWRSKSPKTAETFSAYPKTTWCEDSLGLYISQGKSKLRMCQVIDPYVVEQVKTCN